MVRESQCTRFGGNRRWPSRGAEAPGLAFEETPIDIEIVSGWFFALPRAEPINAIRPASEPSPS